MRINYLLLVLAFIAVYFIWGSTYLAIRIAIETIPPLIMLGLRFGVAGLLMLLWLRLSGAPAPTRVQWKNAGIAGALMLCIGTGSVTFALQYVPSGLAALLISTVPMWMVMLNWLWKKGARPSIAFYLGFALGISGIILLFDADAFYGSLGEGIFAIVIILIGAVSWSVGSLFGKDVEMPENPFMATAIQMFAGGAWLLLSGFLIGERLSISADMLSIRSALAWLYLLVFGSFIAFSAYIWLMKNVSPSKVSTYAFVNPVVAVYLGWLLANEPVTGRVIAASVLLVVAVFIVLRFDRSMRMAKQQG